MTEVLRAAAALQAVCEQYQWRYCFIGGLAVLRWGALLRAPSGVGLDIALGGLPFEESAVARSSMFEFVHGISLHTCSAEDLLVLKSFADRPKDWVDEDGVLIRQKSRLDWPYVLNQLAPLAELKGAPELVDRLEQRRQELEG